MVMLHIPPPLPRAEVLELFGEELGLRIREEPRKPEFLQVDCLSESLRRKALALDGMPFNLGDQFVGTLGVEVVRSTPMKFSEICQNIEAHLSGGDRYVPDANFGSHERKSWWSG